MKVDAIGVLVKDQAGTLQWTAASSAAPWVGVGPGRGH